MDSLLPSEIARLVFGYLEDQKCGEAARSFLESSSHLQECRAVVSNGRRFNTRVNGLTLVDIFDKFTAAHALVQERLSKVSDSEQVRQCGDLLEQLRFLLGGSRGQRFVVNINVPSQTNSQVSGGSPIISSSIRKRHHSGNGCERSKRLSKAVHQLYEKQNEPVSSQLGCDTVEATPLESLPGHSDFTKSADHQKPSQEKDGAFCTSTKSDFVECVQSVDVATFTSTTFQHANSVQQANQMGKSGEMSERRRSDQLHSQMNMEIQGAGEMKPMGKSTATSTEELTSYTCAEVQTTPYAPSESDLTDEPVENLSILTKELLNRTELHERIADNINKAILPADAPFKDDSICESLGGELNTSVMAELNSAIKNIVEATHSDPVFTQFFEEILGPNVETDNSPDEDVDAKLNSGSSTGCTSAQEEHGSVEAGTNSSLCDAGTAAVEVPLKKRLRSSSRQQHIRTEDEGERSKEQEKTGSSLEDHNAAAILSIINANITDEKPVDKNVVDEQATLSNIKSENRKKSPQKLSTTTTPASGQQDADSTFVTVNNPMGSKATKKTPAKKPRPVKLKPVPEILDDQIISEQEMMAMPTLIVCSKEEMTSILNVNPIYPAGIPTPVASTSAFIPIAPKEPSKTSTKPMSPIYLRTVNVPQQVQQPTNNIGPSEVKASVSQKRIETMKVKATQRRETPQSSRRRSRNPLKKPTIAKRVHKPVEKIASTTSKLVDNVKNPNLTSADSITLYANENSLAATVENTNMPAINVDESISLTGTGLSPFLKFKGSKADGSHVARAQEEPSTEIEHPIPDSEQSEATSSKKEKPLALSCSEDALITKRTPKSLIKSRSKNNRLSMSTPRRRSSHIRALDFNTPMKSSNSLHEMDRNENVRFSPKSTNRSRSMCKTTLFKSPPFSNSKMTAQKLKSPFKSRPCKVPIATRSPAPKLMGGWERYTGVGMIISGTSSQPSSATSSPTHNPPQPSMPSPRVVKKSWDADLRKVLDAYKEPVFTKQTKQHKNENAVVQSSFVDEEEACKRKEDGKCYGPSTENDNKVSSQVPAESSEKNISKDPSGDQADTVSKLTNKPDVMTSLITCSEAEPTKDEQVAASEEVKTIDKPVKVPEETIDTAQSVITETLPIDDTSVTTVKNTIKIDEKKVVKKYAQLKTLKTSVTKTVRKTESSAVSAGDSSKRNAEVVKVSPESMRQVSEMPHMMELETPRKLENSFGIPPTPCLLSPSSSNIITPFPRIIGESTKLTSIVSTPDFPPTPNVALTPRVDGQSNDNETKKGAYSTCSPYYQPSNEQPLVLDKLLTSQGEKKLETIPEAPSTSDGMRAIVASIDIANDFNMSTNSSKLEITQFEVIKENLPKEETAKDLKISTSSKDDTDLVKVKSEHTEKECSSIIADQKHISVDLSINVSKTSVESDGNSSESDNESSDSDTNSSSDSSSSSSSCSSSTSGITTTSTPFASVKKLKNTPNKVYTDTSNDSAHKQLPEIINTIEAFKGLSPIIKDDAAQIMKTEDIPDGSDKVLPVTINEKSPLKVFPIMKTEENVESSTKETPAKDEALLSEANISETPSGSKSGIESLTNLASKMSAMNTPEDHGTLKQSRLSNKVHVPVLKGNKPRVTKIEHVLPEVSLLIKPLSVSEMMCCTTRVPHRLALKPPEVADGKMSLQLEEKRLRAVAKMKMKQPDLVSKNSRKEQRASANKLRLQKLAETRNSGKEQGPILKDHKEGREGSELTNKSIEKVKEAECVIENQKTKQDVGNEREQSTKCKNETITKLKTKQTIMSSDIILPNEQKQDECDTMEQRTKSHQRKRNNDQDCKKAEGTVRGKSQPRTSKVDQPKMARRKEKVDKTEQNKLASKEQDVEPEVVCVKLKIKDDSAESFRVEGGLTGAKDNRDKNLKKPNLKNPVKHENVTERRPKVKESVPECSAKQKVHEVADSCSENPDQKESTVNIDIPKIVTKSKVDLVKRDLFSDEENNEQRTTRSRTRQLSDAQKHEAASSQITTLPAATTENNSADTPEQLSSVLECLELVPTNKNDIIEEVASMLNHNNSMSNCAELNFMYDDSAPGKRKKRKYNNTELEYEVNVEFSQDNYKERKILMAATVYEEIFNITPTPKKRVRVSKRPSQSAKSARAGSTKQTSGTDSMTKNQNLLMKPLATSSPSIRPSTSKVTNLKSASATNRDPLTKVVEAKPNSNIANSRGGKKEETNKDLLKRKLSSPEGNQQIEKKSRITDPQLLLSKLDLDEFLTSVHGPT